MCVRERGKRERELCVVYTISHVGEGARVTGFVSE